MILIWRGMGLVVPITFAVCCYIVSFWIPSSNTNSLIGWASLYTAIVCLLLGLSTLGTQVEYEGGKIAPNWRHHHFFYIPMIIWPGVLTVLCLFMLIERSPDAGFELDEESRKEIQAMMDAAEKEKMIHFFNPSGDTLIYYVSDEEGYGKEEKLASWEVADVLADSKSYDIAGYTLDGEYTLTLPWDDNYDPKKYKEVKKKQGKVNQRIVQAATEEINDYDDAWVMVNGFYNLMVIDVNDLYSANLKKERIDDINWLEKIHSKHSGKELIQLNIKPVSDEKMVLVIDPSEYLPASIDGTTEIFLLLPYHGDKKLTNDFIAGEIKAFCPDK